MVLTKVEPINAPLQFSTQLHNIIADEPRYSILYLGAASASAGLLIARLVAWERLRIARSTTQTPTVGWTPVAPWWLLRMRFDFPIHFPILLSHLDLLAVRN